MTIRKTFFFFFAIITLVTYREKLTSACSSLLLFLFVRGLFNARLIVAYLYYIAENMFACYDDFLDKFYRSQPTLLKQHLSVPFVHI